jgi:hypothetical protein
MHRLEPFREAAYVLLRYLSEAGSPDLDPRSALFESHVTAIELGSGTGIIGIRLAGILAEAGHSRHRVVLTDLPSVCPLLEENLRLHPSLDATHISVAPLAWGNSEHAADIVRCLEGRPLTHIICSDLVRPLFFVFLLGKYLRSGRQVYFPELLAPLLRTLITLTSVPSPPHILISYKIRSFAKESPFWNAFGLWFAFQPVLLRTDGERWERLGADADSFVFCAWRREESQAWAVPADDIALLDGVGARGTNTRKSDDTFELLVLMSVDESNVYSRV